MDDEQFETKMFNKSKPLEFQDFGSDYPLCCPEWSDEQKSAFRTIVDLTKKHFTTCILVVGVETQDEKDPQLTKSAHTFVIDGNINDVTHYIADLMLSNPDFIQEAMLINVERMLSGKFPTYKRTAMK